MKKIGYTRFQKLLPIVSNLTAFLAQFTFKFALSPVLEITRLAAMTTLNAVNLVQSIQQKNVLNTVWNSTFLGMDVFAGLGVARQAVLRKTTLLRKEKNLLSKTRQLRQELSTASYQGTNLLTSQTKELHRVPVPVAPTSLERLGDPNPSFLDTEHQNLDHMQHLLNRQTTGLQKDYHNLVRWNPDTPLSEYQTQQLAPSLLKRSRQQLSLDKYGVKGIPEFVEKRNMELSNLVDDSKDIAQNLQKAQSNLHAIRNTRILNRANNLFTNVKDYAVLEQQQNKPPPSKTSTALQSTQAFLGGL